MSTFAVILRIEMKLVLRDFFTVFFALVFPSLMLLIFGSIFGAYPGQHGATMVDDMTPAYSCIVIGVTGLLSFPMNLASNLERNVYRRFDASPSGKLTIMWGELCANLILTLCGLVILFAFARVFFEVVPQGSWSVIAGSALLDIAAIFGMGFFLVSLAPNTRAALALCYATYFVMLFLSGATLPEMLFPETLRAVSDWLPMTYAVRLMQDAFTDAVPEASTFLVLAGTATGGAAAGSIMFRRRLQ